MPEDTNQPRRRVPQQVRSRGRYERVLEVTADLVVAGGVEAVSTRSIAAAAGVPVAFLYQYFASKEDVLLALLRRDLAEMDAEAMQDLRAGGTLTVDGIVRTTMTAYARVYRRRPALVMIWLRGRTNLEIAGFCRAHKRSMARDLFAVAQGAGVTEEGAVGLYAQLAVEVSDRLFQIAFEDSLEGDDHVIDEGIAVVSAYLKTHAAPGARGDDLTGDLPGAST